MDDEFATGQSPLSRRGFVRGLGALAAVGIAGCASLSPGRPAAPGDTVTPVPGDGRTLCVTPDGTDGGTDGTDAPRPTDPDGGTDAPPTHTDTDTATVHEPIPSIGAAVAAATPGDTVLLHGGTYELAGNVGGENVRGTRRRPIRIAAAPGERPVLDFTGASFGGLRFSNCHWLEIVGLEVVRAPSRGLFVDRGSANVLIEDVTVRESGGDRQASGAGVFVLGSRTVTLRNVVSVDNYDAPSGGRNADGIAIEDSPGCVLEDCVAAWNSDDGFDLWQTGGVTLRRCRSFDNGWGPDGEPAGDGDGFKLGGGTESGDNRAEFCVAFDNRVRGFDDNGATRPVTLLNCTARNHSVNFRLVCDFDFEDPTCPPHYLRNNLSDDGEIRLSPFADSESNSWDLGIDDPAFESITRGDPRYLHLSADSPAIDVGVDVGLPYTGEAPDLGAFEFDVVDTTATDE